MSTLNFCALFAILLIGSVAQDDFNKEWEAFQVEYDRQYTEDEAEYRRNIFIDNLKEIHEHNERYEQGLHGYTKGINQFTDLTTDERKRFLGLRVPVRDRDSKSIVPKHLDFSNKSVPDSIDYREKGAVTPVKDQRHCGSCWAFSVVGAMEGQYFMKTKELINFSEQELVDCSASNSGCHGGLMIAAYQDVAQLGGIETTKSYPYKAKEQNCTFNKSLAVAKITDYHLLEENETILKKTVAEQGPISVGIMVTAAFHDYSGGIFDGDDCKGIVINHGVVIVGYGVDSESNKKYWIIKNSWGKGWGDKGYIRLRMHDNRNCIATYATYPVMEKIN